MAKVIEEQFALKRTESGISEVDVSVATDEGLQEIWRYQVPVGHSIIFSREDTFSAYLENASSVEAAAGSLVDIVIADYAKQATKPLLNQVRYALVKEFQDVTKMAHLDVEVGKVIVVNEGEWVLIRGNILTATLDASDSYFSLTCRRIRNTISE